MYQRCKLLSEEYICEVHQISMDFFAENQKQREKKPTTDII